MGCVEGKEKEGSLTKTTPDSSATYSNPNSNSPKPTRKRTRNIVLVGDPGVGKSSLLLRFTKNEWTDDPDVLREKTTIGADFSTVKIQIKEEELQLNIWDTGGQERYATMTQSYYRQSDCIICVYDVSDSKTLESVPKWWKEMDRYSPKTTVRILVGNKSDMTAAVDSTSSSEVAKNLSATLFFQTSAKNSDNVYAAFTQWISDA